ncbi:Photosystem II repair protein PSB27-H1, chloroplastic [Morella rubra]|uniref:Photosystem II repair protein PSB27-H1, chloroplastic n=1 Tax=Morella rubra TaxID=262757 RepID=A0A6A1VBB7_9ROSI|nr:Photosystem II repair protein PSB27-H1, chloroplastic [Morella rubra]
MASPTLITPTSKLTPLSPIKPKSTATTTSISAASAITTTTTTYQPRRREFLSLATTILSPACLFPVTSALAASEEEYAKETEEVINKIRTTIQMDKSDPNVASAVADLREFKFMGGQVQEGESFAWKVFIPGRLFSNAVSGHYISFGPTSPIPAKRKTRILEEMDTAEKALVRGR